MNDAISSPARQPSRPGHILILVHEHGSLEQTGYYMWSLAKIWREAGITVTVQRGVGPKVAADVAVLHVDLTVIPDDYIAYLRQYPVVLNGGALDISKRAISQHLVRPGDGYTGPVIVKTNLNFKGAPEAQLARIKGRADRIATFLQRVRNKISPPPPMEYQIYPTTSEVPPAAWSDADLIVERLMVERSGEEYITRTYHFLGDQEICNTVYATAAIARPGNIVRRVPTTDIPPGLRERRRELGFDFGKFDYGLWNGKAVVYDANRTPTEGDVPREVLEARFHQLSLGIQAFLPH